MIEEAYASSRALLLEYVAAAPVQRPALVTKLRPRNDDYARVFEPDHAAAAAARGYVQLWGNSPVWPVPPDASVEVFCAVADDFPDTFPGGYPAYACWLKKGVVWACWRFSHGSLFDGLVEVEPGRWAWCPRPWKVLPKPVGPTLYWDE